MHVEEVGDDGAVKTTHALPFAFSMMLPAFRGVSAIRGVKNLVNPRGFVLIDKNQRNPTYQNIFSIGVTVAIPPMGKTPVGIVFRQNFLGSRPRCNCYSAGLGPSGFTNGQPDTLHGTR